MVFYTYVSLPISLPISHIQPLYPSCLSFSMPYLSHRLSLNMASPSIARPSRLLRLLIYMPSPRASQSRSEVQSLPGFEFNAPEPRPTKPKKPPTVNQPPDQPVNQPPDQPNAHIVPPSTYVPIPISLAITGFGISRSSKVAITMIDNPDIPLLSTKQDRSIDLDPKSLLESMKVPHHLRYHKELRINVKQRARNSPLILVGLSSLCSNMGNRI